MKTIKKFLIIVFTSVMLTATGISSVAAEQEKKCRVTITNNETGASYTITVHGVSCGEIIRYIIEALTE